ncbi:hypothetical protein BASA81_008830 [Batrachochytrium salamandrivorans]|nr:hypothetical protein BASA81_008830 [Batrachochytrium salamandrivorans]
MLWCLVWAVLASGHLRGSSRELFSITRFPTVDAFAHHDDYYYYYAEPETPSGPSDTSAPAIPSPAPVFTRFPTPSANEPNTPPPKPLIRPNIVLALADDLGFGDVGFTNRKMNVAKTPNLDLIASLDSTWVLNNFHSEAACSPSRMAILTARSPIRNCVLGSPVNSKTVYNPTAQTVVHLANQLHYRTLFLGKFLPRGNSMPIPATDRPGQLGFQNWTSIEGGSTYDFACVCRDHVGNTSNCFLGHETPSTFAEYEKLCLAQSSPFGQDDFPPRYSMEADFLASKFHTWLEREVLPTEPFLVQISFRSVHVPFVASPELRKACLENEICNPTAKPKTSLELDYAGCVYSIDQAVGRIRDSLKQLRPLDFDNTLFVFMSDNGPAPPQTGGGNAGGMLGNKNSLMFEGLLRVPALINWPRAITENAQVESFLSIMDIPATVAHAISGSPLPDTDGMSILPHIQQANTEFSRPAHFGVCGFTDSGEVKKGLACPALVMYDPTGRWKLIAERVSANRMGHAPASQVKTSTLRMYDLTETNLEAKTTTQGPRGELIRQANLYLSSVFASFRQNCVGYY